MARSKTRSFTGVDPLSFRLILDFVDDCTVLVGVNRDTCRRICADRPVHAVLAAGLYGINYFNLAAAWVVGQVLPAANGTSCGPRIHLLDDSETTGKRLQAIADVHKTGRHPGWMNWGFFDGLRDSATDAVGTALVEAPLEKGTEEHVIPTCYRSVRGFDVFCTMFETTRHEFAETVRRAACFANFCEAEGDDGTQLINSLKDLSKDPFGCIEPFIDSLVIDDLEVNHLLDRPDQIGSSDVHHDAEFAKLYGYADHDSHALDELVVHRKDDPCQDINYSGFEPLEEYVLRMGMCDVRQYFNAIDEARNGIMHELALARTGAIHLDPNASLQEKLKTIVLLPDSGSDSDDSDFIVGDLRRRQKENHAGR
jgi:hypothetical protein